MRPAMMKEVVDDQEISTFDQLARYTLDPLRMESIPRVARPWLNLRIDGLQEANITSQASVRSIRAVLDLIRASGETFDDELQLFSALINSYIEPGVLHVLEVPLPEPRGTFQKHMCFNDGSLAIHRGYYETVLAGHSWSVYGDGKAFTQSIVESRLGDGYGCLPSDALSELIAHYGISISQ